MGKILVIVIIVVVIPIFFRDIAMIITHFYRKAFKKKPPIVDGEVAYPVANMIWTIFLVFSILIAIYVLFNPTG